MKLFGFLNINTIDIIDILIVAILIYQFLRFIKGTKATPILFGLLTIFLISFIARWFNLRALAWIMNSILAVWVVAFVILFQPEIRSALAFIGRQRPLRFFFKIEPLPTVSQIVDAVKKLAERHHGGLLVIQRNDSLGDIIETGVRIDALVNSILIQSIFFPDNPLHDGACVIQGDKIVAAACVLPLSENPDLGGRFGLRHRAALGIAEHTDAFCIVVSEETGKISFAYRGKLITKVSPDALTKTLKRVLKE
jgi:diadenylate cyclase|uniref:Diadenylate cyclase n=1 Tax=candidate division WOR-3 bacterium TaxID=2052148 RepID=A0A7V3RI47_UNCW3